ncbi:hypothetical protein ACWEK5_46590 [Rhodococcus koreensis]
MHEDTGRQLTDDLLEAVGAARTAAVPWGRRLRRHVTSSVPHHPPGSRFPPPVRMRTRYPRVVRLAGIPRAVLRVEYSLARIPLQLLEDLTAAHLDEQAPTRLAYEQFLIGCDRAAHLLGDKNAAARAADLRRHTTAVRIILAREQHRAHHRSAPAGPTTDPVRPPGPRRGRRPGVTGVNAADVGGAETNDGGQRTMSAAGGRTGKWRPSGGPAASTDASAQPGTRVPDRADTPPVRRTSTALQPPKNFVQVRPNVSTAPEQANRTRSRPQMWVMLEMESARRSSASSVMDSRGEPARTRR